MKHLMRQLNFLIASILTIIILNREDHDEHKVDLYFLSILSILCGLTNLIFIHHFINRKDHDDRKVDLHFVIP